MRKDQGYRKGNSQLQQIVNGIAHELLEWLRAVFAIVVAFGLCVWGAFFLWAFAWLFSLFGEILF